MNKVVKFFTRSIFFMGLLLFIACKVDNKTKPSLESPDKITAPDDRIASELYEGYYNNPTTQDQKDQNLLIEYISDKGLQVQRTPSGLYYQVTEEGNGPMYVHGQPCRAHYQGYFLDGKVFDSSYNRGEPIDFRLGQMNAGWNEALKLLRPGAKATLFLPSRLGYGAKGFPGFVPPNTCILFDLELLRLAE
jgi:FKBP-type peptidyl-prolyl cis-trans isomerase FkpA/FKBP-type peptidyl-prolyl cis-trans isomerase FklB